MINFISFYDIFGKSIIHSAYVISKRIQDIGEVFILVLFWFPSDFFNHYLVFLLKREVALAGSDLLFCCFCFVSFVNYYLSFSLLRRSLLQNIDEELRIR